MNIEKLIERLSKANSPTALSEFTRLAHHYGFVFDHATGSHHVFRHWTGRKYVVPVHQKRIKAVYARNFLEEQQ
ncbi:MAG: type II toxin-antitoxin system HicA family toxin [Bacteroidota bacterium]